MVLEKKANAEPIPGYRLLELLGTGGFGEVWKCEAPGGIFKAVKFVYGNINGLSTISKRAENELKAVQHIKSIRHPFLLSIDRLECIEGELVIVTELADRNMCQLLQEHQSAGRVGIPRQDLLLFLREAAEVLDMLNTQCNLQHLDVKPGNLFLVGKHVKVADFGLVQSLSLNQPAGQLGAITPLYAAPEIFMSVLSRHCDQYSLAIVYQELLTGTVPFDGKNPRHLLLQHTKQEPDLRALSPADRAIVAKALHKSFNQRFGSCLEFIRALTEAESPSVVSAAVPSAADTAKIHVNDTLVAAGQDTVKWRPTVTPNLPPGVLSGCKFQECINNNSLVETWKAQTANGKPQLVHFVYGCTLTEPQKLQELGARLNSLQHPGLVPAEVAHAERGRLILTGPAITESLRDRFLQCQKLKQPGIMRGELGDYIRAAAEILDYLYQQHSVQHLGLNPRNILLDKGWLQLEEFGFGQLVWMPSGQDLAQRNARYSAPELFQQQPGRASDQYSLAVIFVEMLTGRHPFHGQDPRNRRQPDLEKLTEHDRAVIARALHADPAQRWPSATDMALALEGTEPEIQQQLQQEEDPFAQLIKKPKRGSGLPSAHAVPQDLPRQIRDIITSVGGKVEGLPMEAAPVLDYDQRILSHRFQVSMPLGSVHQELAPLHTELGGQLISQTESARVMIMALPTTFWQRVRGRLPAVEVRIDLSRVNPMSATPVEVALQIGTRNVEHSDSLAILERHGPAIVERLRARLVVGSEKRMQDRLLWPHVLQVVPVYADGTLEDPVECRGKDISFTGMGLYLPHELDTAEVILHVANSVHPGLEIPATLVRARRCADGWYDVGTLFHLPVKRKSMAEICIPAHAAG